MVCFIADLCSSRRARAFWCRSSLFGITGFITQIIDARTYEWDVLVRSNYRNHRILSTRCKDERIFGAQTYTERLLRVRPTINNFKPIAFYGRSVRDAYAIVVRVYFRVKSVNIIHQAGRLRSNECPLSSVCGTVVAPPAKSW